MLRFIMLATFCAACGTDDSKDAAPAVTTQTDASEAPLYAVNAVKDLPYCELTNNGAVVYVLPTKEFKVCDATTGTWYAIDVKGDKGDAGSAGKAGAVGAGGAQGERGATGPVGPAGATGATGERGQAGAAGRDGADGDAGRDGVAGHDGQSVTGTMWLDPIANRYWTFTNIASTLAEAQATCVDGWRLPTAEEWRTANLRGLNKVTNSASLDIEAWLQDGTHKNPQGTTSSNTAAPYCVEDAP